MNELISTFTISFIQSNTHSVRHTLFTEKRREKFGLRCPCCKALLSRHYMYSEIGMFTEKYQQKLFCNCDTGTQWESIGILLGGWKKCFYLVAFGLHTPFHHILWPKKSGFLFFFAGTKSGTWYDDPEKSRITNSIFLAIQKIKGFSIFPWGRLGKLSHIRGRLSPQMKHTQSKFDICGSNETMQNALASIV